MESRGSQELDRDRIVARIMRRRGSVLTQRKVVDELAAQIEQDWYLLGRFDEAKR